MIGFLMELSPEIRAELPVFETIMEMEASYGGAYAGYRNETKSPMMTLPEFMELFKGRRG